jgi:hypothetical protein
LPATYVSHPWWGGAETLRLTDACRSLSNRATWACGVRWVVFESGTVQLVAVRTAVILPPIVLAG